MRIRTIIIGGAIISIIAGFALSKTVVANSPTPGSSEDPVVSKLSLIHISRSQGEGSRSARSKKSA